MLDFLLGLGVDILKGAFRAAGIEEKWRRRKELNEYLKAIVASYEHTTARPLSPIYHRFDLPHRYVVPTLALPNGDRRTARDYLLERCNSDEDFRLLIHGIFGSGKTALCLDLGYHLARQAVDTKWRPRIPLYVSLQGLASQSQAGLEEFFKRCLADYHLATYKTFGEFLEKEEVVLLLDGFDQMDISGLQFARAHLLGLIHSCLGSTKTKVVLTMRSGYFETSPILFRGLQGQLRTHPESDTALHVRSFEMIYLEGLSDSQILEYLTRHPCTQSVDPQELLDRLRANVHLAEVARHPLLLNMILDVGAKVLLSSKVFDLGYLYKTYTDYWLQHDSTLAIFTSPTEKRHFVEDLAFAVLQAGSETGVYLDGIKGIDGNADWTSVRDILTLQRPSSQRGTRSFLLINHDGSLMFAHRSLGEYFCAIATIRLLRQGYSIPGSLWSNLYSNLVIWFMRCTVEDSDYDWVASMVDEVQDYPRCLAYALLPAVAGQRKEEVIKLFLDQFEIEPNMDAKRHILWGIGWLGGNPCTPEFLAFIRSHQEEWQEACAPYYHSIERQREHCIRRLMAFHAGDREFYGSRGLYILDLAEVGKQEDIELIEPYTDPSREVDPVMREIALDAIHRIEQRVGESRTRED